MVEEPLLHGAPKVLDEIKLTGEHNAEMSSFFNHFLHKGLLGLEIWLWVKNPFDTTDHYSNYNYCQRQRLKHHQYKHDVEHNNTISLITSFWEPEYPLNAVHYIRRLYLQDKGCGCFLVISGGGDIVLMGTGRGESRAGVRARVLARCAVTETWSLLPSLSGGGINIAAVANAAPAGHIQHLQWRWVVVLESLCQDLSLPIHLAAAYNSEDTEDKAQGLVSGLVAISSNGHVRHYDNKARGEFGENIWDKMRRKRGNEEVKYCVLVNFEIWEMGICLGYPYHLCDSFDWLDNTFAFPFQ
ncbi:hypothetical protein B0H34DRAFT_822530 [Crassisporium funariophilum]|nr:hypothetical protein B0H34DRAFT_822530 [Crassisporium funariophilum]